LSVDRPAVLHAVASFTERDGGPARYISELCGELAARGRPVTILTVRPPGIDLMPVPEGVSVVALPAGAGRTVSAAAGLWLQANPRGLVHLHGLWRAVVHHAAAAARHAARPVVWAPMGMLEPWALRHRGWKKRLAWSLYQRRDLAAAAAVHATSRLEADGIRGAGVRTPIAVIPLGVAAPEPRPDRLVPAGVRTALFLSRIHPKKGLLILLEAWARLRPPGWRLVIAGNDEGGHTAEVTAAIALHGLADVVHLSGPTFGAAKEKAFAEADLFVLPSLSENFGVVVAEALVRGLPVLTTTGTPWSDVVTARAGWWVDPTPEAVGVALADATNRSETELRAMGRAGMSWATREFSWPEITNRIEAVYRWIARPPERPGARPQFVPVLQENSA
jgi:glycosyltransferase involved in cell wall biosynthesis